MPKKISNFLYWFPRILSILFICFLALFSLDVFQPGLSWQEIALGLFMHNIPALILAAITIVSWKREYVAGVVFMAAGVLYAASVIPRTLSGLPGLMALLWILQISGPAFLIGILFVVNWRARVSARVAGPTHEEKVARIARQMREHKGDRPVSLKKRAVSHEVPKTLDKRDQDDKIDLSDLNEIISIDPETKTCVAESGVTFVDLVGATLKRGLVPFVVPELKTITLGGAVSGCSIESMSYKVGGFHDSCLEYEVITGKGEILTCTPDNENRLIFQMVHGTFGTLGIITKLKFRLAPAKPFVKIAYHKYANLEDYKASIKRHYDLRDVEFMDGIIHSPTEFVLSTAEFVDSAPYAHAYDWTRVYYLSTRTRKEDYLKTADYFFRYDKGVTNVTPKSFLGRLLFGKFVDSSKILRLANFLRKRLPPDFIPVTVDTFIPFSKAAEFMDWYVREVNFFPLWCVPYRAVRPYEWIDPAFLAKSGDELFLDLAIYGMKKSREKDYYKILEDKLMDMGALKTLISTNYYSEEDFWKIWNKPNYDRVKRLTDPGNVFRDLYAKMCRATRGLS